MKKTLLKRLIYLLIPCMIFTGCSGSSATDESEETAEEAVESAYTFTDDLGREVTVDNPQRVVAMIGSFTDVWMLAGGTVVAAASDAWTSLNLDLADDVINIGTVKDPNFESVLSADPDFIIASTNTSANLEFMDTFDSLGIPTAYFDVSNFSDYLRMLKICTDITGREDLYVENGASVAALVEESIARADGSAPTVLYIRSSVSSILAKSSEGNVCGEILADLGCTNIADSDTSLLDNLSIEAIMKNDPEYIFIVPQGSDKEAALQNIEDTFTSSPAWQSLSAVQNGKYYVLDPNLYNLKPNELWGEAYSQMADILYPEQ